MGPNGLHWADARHSEACDALGASDGVIHSNISVEAVSSRAPANSFNKSSSRVMRIFYLLPLDYVVPTLPAAKSVTYVFRSPQIRQFVAITTNPAGIVAAQPCNDCLLYTSPSPRDRQKSRMPSSA